MEWSEHRTHCANSLRPIEGSPFGTPNVDLARDIRRSVPPRRCRIRPRRRRTHHRQSKLKEFGHDSPTTVLGYSPTTVLEYSLSARDSGGVS